LRYRSPILQRAADGFFTALAGWRTVSVRLAQVPEGEARQQSDMIMQTLPQKLRSALAQSESQRWLADPIGPQRVCTAAAEKLIALPAAMPSSRLLMDHTAEGFTGISGALSGLALLIDDPVQPVARGVRLRVPDWLPGLVNAGRAFVTIAAVQLFWIITAWPNGAIAMIFAAIVVIVFSRRADQAFASALGYMIGAVIAAGLAAIVAFAALPGLEHFSGLCIALGFVLVPAGALMAQSWQTSVFTAIAGLFVPLLAPANQMSYNTEQFYNSAFAIVSGVGVAVLSFRLLPPLAPLFRARRLLALSLRDLRRLATRPISRISDGWDERIFGRLSVLPDEAHSLQRSQLLAALCLGGTVIRLRHIVRGLNLSAALDGVLRALARGQSATAIARLATLDQMLASRPELGPEALRARSLVLAISGTLNQHSAFFDAGVRG